MTCDDVLVRLLDADPDELNGRGQSPAALHVQTCAKCAAIAGALLEETAALGAAIAGTATPVTAISRAPAPRRSRALPWLVPAGLAAAGIVALAVGREPGPAPASAPATAPLVAAVHAPVEVTAPAISAGEASALPTAVVARAVDVTPVPLPDAIAPAQVGAPIPDHTPAPELVVIAHRNTAGNPDSSLAPVVVRPPRGSDVRVTHARNSNITIVWISDAR